MKKGAKDKKFFNLKKASSDTKLNDTVNEVEVMSPSEDILSENTKKKFKNMCEFYEIKYFFYGQMEELGKSIGKEFRASLAVTDVNFAKAIEKQINVTSE